MAKVTLYNRTSKCRICGSDIYNPYKYFYEDCVGYVVCDECAMKLRNMTMRERKALLI